MDLVLKQKTAGLHLLVCARIFVCSCVSVLVLILYREEKLFISKEWREMNQTSPSSFIRQFSERRPRAD